MYGMKLEGKVNNISSSARTDDGVVERRDKVTLCFEFTKEFAGALNGEAATLQKLLRQGEITACSMNADALGIAVVCADGDKNKVEVVGSGAKLNFKAPNKEDANPQAQLVFSIQTADATHMWFVKHLEETVDVQITKRQLELAV